MLQLDKNQSLTGTLARGTDRERDGQSERQADRQTGRQADRQAVKQSVQCLSESVGQQKNILNRLRRSQNITFSPCLFSFGGNGKRSSI